VVAYHETEDFDSFKFDKKSADLLVPVDSGQAGIFEYDHYYDHDVITWDPHNKDITGEEDIWYGACYDITKKEIGCIPFGLVSGSGWGFGVYETFF